ncbi:MAG: hypothetical protein JWN44_2733 [Myxococcales bacterium]|nr:hypothetical protein [Myxococcales bacterium]
MQVCCDPMDRRYRRWLAFASARLTRAMATARQAVLTDVDVTTDQRVANLAEAEAFAASAAELGAAVAKIAQVRAYLDVAGVATTGEARAMLARLWDRMPPRPASVIRGVVEAELGAPIADRFAKWDDTPIAAASLGQVHAAEDADGKRFAVKVQYPGVAESLRDDLSSASLLRRVVGAQLGPGAATDTLEVMRAQLLGELDYVAEAGWLERFRLLLGADKTIAVPRVDRARSTARVLTMERLDGQTLPALADGGDLEARNRAATAIFRFAFGAPLQHGIFNADPHPGNYLVLDGAIGFVDFGSAAELTPEMRAADHQLFLSMIHRDGEALRHAANLEGLVADAKVFEGSIWREWEQTLAAPFLRRGEVTLSPAHVGRVITLTGELLRARRIALPPGAMLLWRQRLGALAVLAGLRPKLNFRKLLAGLLDDGRNPIVLYDRWR